MNKNVLSPYVRVAMYSIFSSPFFISNRVIFDYEIIFVASGKCKITYEGHEYICKKNDVIFIRPGIDHSFENVGDRDFVQPHIHYDMVYNDKSEETYVSFKPLSFLTDYEHSLLQKDIVKDLKIPPVFVPDDINAFKSIFYDIIDSYKNKNINSEIYLKLKMLELLRLIFNQFDSFGSNDIIKTNDVQNIAVMAKNYIDNNFMAYLTLEILSKQLYVNKFTLLRNFKSIYDKNIMTYYKEKRIEYIKNALISTDVSITDIAKKMNFSDIFTFSRFFKTAVGCSPTNYRNDYYSNNL